MTSINHVTDRARARRAAAAVLAMATLACSGGEKTDDGTAMAATVDSTTMAAGAPVVAANDSAMRTSMGADSMAQPAGVKVDSARAASSSQASRRDSTTPSPVAQPSDEQVKTKRATPTTEAKRLDAATRAVARAGATTRDTAPAGRVTPAPAVRKTATTASRTSATPSTAASAPEAAGSTGTPSPASPTAPASAAASGASATSATSASTVAATDTPPPRPKPTTGGATGAAGATQTAGADKLTATPAAYQGWKTFHVYCYRCHGTDAMGSDLAPNLRASVSPAGSVTKAVFVQTLNEGRIAKGMPAWKTVLNAEQIDQLYAYLMARSKGELAAGRPKQAKGQ